MSPIARLLRARPRLFLLCVVMAGLPGCAQQWSAIRVPFRRPEPCLFPETVALPELLAHINMSRSPLHAWKSMDCSVTIPGPGGLPLRLSAAVSAQAPERFRLMVSSLKGVEADLGSNAEQVWFWIPTFRPEIITASQARTDVMLDAFGLPMQPNWILEILGIGEIHAENLELRRHGPGTNRLSLVELKALQDGRLLEHHIIIDTCRGHIVEHQLIDTRGQLLARAELSHYRLVDGLELAHRLRLHWPLVQQEITLNLREIVVNPADLNEKVWEFPAKTGTPVRDLGAHVRSPTTQEPPPFADEPFGEEQAPAFAEEASGTVAEVAWERPIERRRPEVGSTNRTADASPAVDNPFETRPQEPEAAPPFEQPPAFEEPSRSAVNDPPLSTVGEQPTGNPFEDAPPQAATELEPPRFAGDPVPFEDAPPFEELDAAMTADETPFAGLAGTDPEAQPIPQIPIEVRMAGAETPTHNPPPQEAQPGVVRLGSLQNTPPAESKRLPEINPWTPPPTRRRSESPGIVRINDLGNRRPSPRATEMSEPDWARDR